MNEISKTDIYKVAQGLSCHSNGFERLLDAKRRYLYEIAELICGAIDDPAEITEDLSRTYKMAVKENLQGLSREDKATISLYLTNLLLEKFNDLDFQTFGITESSKPSTVNYVKNAYSDLAYLRFDESIGGLLSEYADSFLVAAQSVYYESSSACILPYLAHDGSIMTGNAKLIETYDLVKSAVFTIDTGGVQNSEFALYTHGVWNSKSSDTIEFIVKSDDPFYAESILTACRIFSFSHISHCQRNSPVDGESYALFTATSENISSHIAMIVFLVSEFERFNITGFYKKPTENQL